MRASRGMGAVNPAKLPKKVQKKGGSTIDVYAKGGGVKHPASCSCKPCKGTA